MHKNYFNILSNCSDTEDEFMDRLHRGIQSYLAAEDGSDENLYKLLLAIPWHKVDRSYRLYVLLSDNGGYNRDCSADLIQWGMETV